jgi:hypothetical protein
MSKVETPKYKVIEKFCEIEIRLYEPMIVAECEVEGERREAIRKGFRILASYIFGGNTKDTKVAMTAPVTQQHGEGSLLWKVRFGMPSSYKNISDLPRPKDARIRFVELNKKYVVIRFSGMMRQNNLNKHYEKLRAFVQENGLKTTLEPIFAFYNPPWTLPFFRRNEILLELVDS